MRPTIPAEKLQVNPETQLDIEPVLTIIKRYFKHLHHGVSATAAQELLDS